MTQSRYSQSGVVTFLGMPVGAYMDIGSANIEAYRRYHDFHERFNVTFKVLTASTIRTTSYLSSKTCPEKLGDLIIAADPAWKMPPVWEYDPKLTAAVIGSVTNLGIINVYSAIDDFRVNVEGEISRWESFSGTAIPVGTTAAGKDPDCLLMPILRRYGWFDGTHLVEFHLLAYFDFGQELHRAQEW
jgi:hypothetical protein